MARILVIHGTGGPSRAEGSLGPEWITAMQDGLALAGHDPAGLDGSGLRFVSVDSPGPRPGAVTGREAALARRWWRAARFDGSRRGPQDPADTTALVAALAWSRFFAGAPADELLAALRATLSLLDADAAGQQAIRAAAAAMDPGVRIVIGHALGAAAAVAALSGGAGRDGRRVESLVTIGAPAGLRHAARRPAAARWVNLTDSGDALAEGAGLASGTDSPTRDIWLDCDPRLRAPRNYLASPEFGDVLATALRSAG
jgi:hypothetical protein